MPEDELGNGYEYLIKQFADDSGHTAQEFYTNRTLVHLMMQMLEPQPGERIYDPTCGTGGMLISALAEVKRRGGEHRTLGLYGQELIHITAAIARMNLFLHGVEDFDDRRAATRCRNPAFIEGDRLQTFDVVLANPPYSIKKWNREAWQQRPLGPQLPRHAAAGPRRLRLLPAHPEEPRPEDRPLRDPLPARRALPQRRGGDARASSSSRTCSSASSASGPNLFYNSPMEACVVVCRTRKPPDRQGKVLFIDAVHEVARERAQSFLTAEHQERIARRLSDVRRRAGLRQRSRRSTRFSSKDGNLSIPRYVRPIGARRRQRRRASSRTLGPRSTQDGREFWQQMDALVDMLDGVVAEEASDV